MKLTNERQGIICCFILSKKFDRRENENRFFLYDAT